MSKDQRGFLNLVHKNKKLNKIINNLEISSIIDNHNKSIS